MRRKSTPADRSQLLPSPAPQPLPSPAPQLLRSPAPPFIVIVVTSFRPRDELLTLHSRAAAGQSCGPIRCGQRRSARAASEGGGTWGAAARRAPRRDGYPVNAGGALHPVKRRVNRRGRVPLAEVNVTRAASRCLPGLASMLTW